MKKIVTFLLLTCFTSIMHSQKHELGFFLGGTNYIGDIGSTSYINPNEFAGGIVYKLNLNNRIALRANLSYFVITGDDANSNNSQREERFNGLGASFENVISELGVGIEFNFFDYQIDVPSKNFTPYIMAEIAVFNYEVLSTFSDTDRVFDNKFSYSIPVGVGIKGKLIGNVGYAIESGIRFTFTDELDYTTDRFNESIDNRFDFGGNGDDFYVVTGFSLVYSFGRPPCYAPLPLD